MAKRAEAETAFVLAALRALPAEALKELFSLKPEDTPSWAEKWHVNAPSLLERATELLTGLTPDEQLRMQNGSLRVDRSFGYQRPPEWRIELSNLDALPRSLLRRDVRDKVRSTYVKEYEACKLADDEEMLAPLSADPLQETREHFMRRAFNHYLARKLRLNRVAKGVKFTVKVVKPWPELRRHISWILRFQLNGQSFTEIAQSPGSEQVVVQEAAVEKAVRHIARLIKLRLRPLSRGRPRTRKSK